MQGYGGVIAAVVAAVGITLTFAYFARKDKRGSSPPKDGPPPPKEPKGPVALNPIEKIPFKLIKKKNVSHDTRKFTFALQTKKHILGLPVGKCGMCSFLFLPPLSLSFPPSSFPHCTLHFLPLPISRFQGNHMYISANIGGKIESRPYTPITSDDELGYFELVIKVGVGML